MSSDGPPSDEGEETISSCVAEILGVAPHTVQIAPIMAGGNNKTYRAETHRGTLFVKVYFRSPTSTFDRGEHEYQFSRYLWSRGCRVIPEPIGFNPIHGIALFEFRSGSAITSQYLSERHVGAALEFIKECNMYRESSDAVALPQGVESAFSIRGHQELIERRVARLRSIPSDTMKAFVGLTDVISRIQRRWVEVCERLDSILSPTERECELPHKARCLSPSDFGFHNSAEDANGVFFYDFEYAGWDDPGKILSDFFLQPRVRIPTEFRDRAIQVVASCAGCSREEMSQRLETLFPLYHVKWCCILLNDFLVEGNERRVFAGGTEVTERRTSQLAKAIALLREQEAR